MVLQINCIHFVLPQEIPPAGISLTRPASSSNLQTSMFCGPAILRTWVIKLFAKYLKSVVSCGTLNRNGPGIMTGNCSRVLCFCNMLQGEHLHPWIHTKYAPSYTEGVQFLNTFDCVLLLRPNLCISSWSVSWHKTGGPSTHASVCFVSVWTYY